MRSILLLRRGTRPVSRVNDFARGSIDYNLRLFHLLSFLFFSLSDFVCSQEEKNIRNANSFAEVCIDNNLNFFHLLQFLFLPTYFRERSRLLMRNSSRFCIRNRSTSA